MADIEPRNDRVVKYDIGDVMSVDPMKLLVFEHDTSRFNTDVAHRCNVRYRFLALVLLIGAGLPQGSRAVDHDTFFLSLDESCKKPSYQQCLSERSHERLRCNEKDSRTSRRKCLKRTNSRYKRCKLAFDDRCLSAQAKWLGKIHTRLGEAAQHSKNVEQILQACADRNFSRPTGFQQLMEHCVRIETAKARDGSPALREKKVSIDIQCSDVLRCEDLHSRVEASYHFGYCGLARLDGDRNGVACDEYFDR